MKNTWLFPFACATAIALAPALSAAAPYAGFELCSKSSVAAVTKAVESSGGAVKRVIDQTYPDEVIVIASNVPVDATRRSVSVTLYKGAIAYVSLGNAGDMVPAIEAKYGTNFTTSRKEEKVGVTNIHHFQDPADPAMELTVSQFTVAANGAIFYSVNYACKAVYTEVERAREAYAKAAAPK